MAEFFDQTPLTSEEYAAAREGFKHCYQDFWRNQASAVGATPVQLGLISEVVASKVEELRGVKSYFFEQAITTDGRPWWSRRRKFFTNMQDVDQFSALLRENHPGISDYEVTDSAMDLIIMRKPERTEQMGIRLAAVLASDPKIASTPGMMEVVIRAAYSIYNRENVERVQNTRRR